FSRDWSSDVCSSDLRLAVSAAQDLVPFVDDLRVLPQREQVLVPARVRHRLNDAGALLLELLQPGRAAGVLPLDAADQEQHAVGIARKSGVQGKSGGL